MGINGTDVIHKITPKLSVSDLKGQILTKSQFAILEACPLCLMGRDLMSKLGLNIKFDSQGGMTAKSSHCDLTMPKRQDLTFYFMSFPGHLEGHAIRATSKTDVGHVLCTPYVPTFKPDASPTYQKQ